jgi:adhesin transport system outer membrane protein
MNLDILYYERCHKQKQAARTLGFTSLLLFALALCSSVVQAMDLRQIIDATVASHPSIQAQRALRDGAQNDVKSAQQQFWPTPSVTVENVRAGAQDGAYQGNATVQTYRLQQPLWTGGRLTAGLNKAQANLQVAQHAHDDMVQQLSLRAVQAWTDWYAASLKLAAIDNSVLTHQRLYDQVRRRVQEGASAAVELVLTEGRLAQTAAQRAGIQAQLLAAKLKVGQLMGSPVPMPEKPTENLIFNTDGSERLEEAALQRSPALQRQAALLDAQKAELAERQAELWPEIYLRAEHQNGQYANSALSSGSVSRYYIGLSSRFGAGLSSLTALTTLQRKLEASEADLQANRRNVREQVQTDWQQWTSVRARLPELERSVQASQKTAEAWDRQFLAGRKSWLEVMNTARELLQAELELADALAANAQMRWRLALQSLSWDEVSQMARSPQIQSIR